MKVCPVLSNRVGQEKKDIRKQNNLKYLNDCFERSSNITFKALKDVQKILVSEESLKQALKETGASKKFIQLILDNSDLSDYPSFCRKIAEYCLTTENRDALMAFKEHLKRIEHSDMADAITERVIPKMQNSPQMIYA